MPPFRCGADVAMPPRPARQHDSGDFSVPEDNPTPAKTYLTEQRTLGVFRRVQFPLVNAEYNR